jgi:hypothetical protein
MRPTVTIAASLVAALSAASITGCSTVETPAPASYAFSNSPEPIRSAKRGDEKSMRQFLSWAPKYQDGASAEAYVADLGELALAVGDTKLAHVLQTMALGADDKKLIWDALSDAYPLDERKLRKDFPQTRKVLGK